VIVIFDATKQQIPFSQAGFFYFDSPDSPGVSGSGLIEEKRMIKVYIYPA
jgi:hypothetical protein